MYRHPTPLFLRTYFYVHDYVPEYMYMCHMSSGVHRGQKVALGPLELPEVVNCHVSAEN